MPDATVQLIEDPEIAALVAEMKRKWPAIGAAADHPLTEHIIQRIRESIASRKQFRKEHPFKVNPRDKSLPEMLAGSGDKGLFEQFWMAPVSFNTVIGCTLAMTYYFHHQKAKEREYLKRGLPLAISGLTCLLPIAGVMLNPAIGQRAGFASWTGFHWSFVAIMTYMLIALLLNIATHEATRMREMVVWTRVVLARKQRRFLMSGSRPDLPLVAGALIGLPSLWAFGHALVIGNMTIYAPVAICSTFLMYCYSRFITERDVDEMFTDMIKKEEPLYHEYVTKYLES